MNIAQTLYGKLTFLINNYAVFTLISSCAAIVGITESDRNYLISGILQVAKVGQGYIYIYIYTSISSETKLNYYLKK